MGRGKNLPEGAALVANSLSGWIFYFLSTKKNWKLNWTVLLSKSTPYHMEWIVHSCIKQEDLLITGIFEKWRDPWALTSLGISTWYLDNLQKLKKNSSAAKCGDFLYYVEAKHRLLSILSVRRPWSLSCSIDPHIAKVSLMNPDSFPRSNSFFHLYLKAGKLI